MGGVAIYHLGDPMTVALSNKIMRPEKWMVSKGWEGFADRIQCLSYCIDLAVKYNRLLYVDWRDSMWQEGFYRYFSVDGFDEIPPEGEAYPEFWTNALMRSNGQWLYSIKDFVSFKIEDAHGDVPVWVHCGAETWDWNMVTLAKRLRVRCLDELKMPDDVEVVVHLRGTDRPPDLDRVRELAETHRNADVVSDDARCVREWLKVNPKARILTDTLAEDGNAIHKDGLKGKSRHELNLRAISDFMTLAFAPQAYASNEESNFYRFARIYGGCYKDQMT
jgi:hypothetical protein